MNTGPPPQQPKVLPADIVVVKVEAPHGDKYCLSSASGRIYWPYKTLKDCIYGKVKAAVELVQSPDEPGVFNITKTYVAIKLIHKKGANIGLPISTKMFTSHAENPVTETAYQQYLSTPGYPYVAKVVEACENAEAMFVVIEYCNQGELFDVVQSRGHLDEKLCKRLFMQIVLGVHYIHSKGIVHRDLSLENVMVHNGDARIIDFGMATPLPADGLLEGFRGKVYYIAPEVFYHRYLGKYKGPPIDVWALGPMLHIMLVGAPPWEKAWVQDQRFIRAINNKLHVTLEEWGVELSEDCINLMQAIMQAKFTLKINQESILMHPWLVPVRDLIPTHLRCVLEAPRISSDNDSTIACKPNISQNVQNINDGMSKNVAAGSDETDSGPILPLFKSHSAVLHAVNTFETIEDLISLIRRLPPPVNPSFRKMLIKLLANHNMSVVTTRGRVRQLLIVIVGCLADIQIYKGWLEQRKVEGALSQNQNTGEDLFTGVDESDRVLMLQRWISWLTRRQNIST